MQKVYQLVGTGDVFGVTTITKSTSTVFTTRESAELRIDAFRDLLCKVCAMNPKTIEINIVELSVIEGE